MPAVGERKVKDGVLGEWDGQTWRLIARPGDRKTRDGVTGEWDGLTWRQVNAPELPSAPTAVTQQATTSAPRGIAETVADALPTVGGMVGGMYGPLGAVIGGAAGEGLRQIARHAAQIPGALADVARNVIDQPSATFRGAAQGMLEGAANAGMSGAVQGVSDVVGSRVIAPIARGIYGTALRPVKALSTKYGRANLIQEGFANRVWPTASGVEKAAQLVDQSKAAQGAMAQAYDASGGAPLDTVDVVRSGVLPLIRQARVMESAVGAPTGTGASGVIEQARRVIAQPRMSATQMQVLKRAADDIADPAYLAAARGGQPVLPGSPAANAKGFSKGYRETLNTALGDAFQRQGQLTKTRYGLKRAVQDAANRNEMAASIMSGVAGAASSEGNVGTGLRNTLLVRALLTPRIMAGASFTLPMAYQGMRAVAGPFESQMRDELLAEMAARSSK